MLVANMIEFVSSSSPFMTKRTTKTPPQAQHELISIIFVIDKEENDKDATTGATMIESYQLRHH